MQAPRTLPKAIQGCRISNYWPKLLPKAILLLTALSTCTVARGQTLAQALDATNLTWTTSGTGGASGWIPQTATTHDGVDAARSGSANNSSQTSTVQTTVTGPGTLSFWWYDSSIYGELSFYIGNSFQTNVFNTPFWRQHTFFLGGGSQTL